MGLKRSRFEIILILFILGSVILGIWFLQKNKAIENQKINNRPSTSNSLVDETLVTIKGNEEFKTKEVAL